MFACRNRFQYSQERARQIFAKNGKLFATGTNLANCCQPAAGETHLRESPKSIIFSGDFITSSAHAECRVGLMMGGVLRSDYTYLPFSEKSRNSITNFTRSLKAVDVFLGALPFCFRVSKRQ